MLIVDNKFGAEIVSNKGKIYKFDATECMINFFRLGKINKDEVSFYLVTDASEPAELIDAIKSFYLISEKFPSPMGANLSAFERIETAEKFLLIYGGEIKNWYELLSYFNVK
jgi:copper chaperone NosL